MEDINKMTLKDFNNLNEYLKIKDKIGKNQPIPLKKSQKEMIKRTKEK